MLVDNGQISPFKGDLSDYQTWLLQSKAEKASNHLVSEAKKDSQKNNKEDKKSLRQAAAAKREALRPLTNAIKKIDKKMESLNSSLKDIENQLADETLYQKDGSELTTLLKEQAILRASLEECEVQWLEKNEELDNLQIQGI